MKSRQKFSRRAFLQAAGASPLLLPLLEPELARAGCLTNPPKRAVFVIWGNGACPGNARANWPTGPSETTFTLPPGMESLEPHKSDLLFIDALNYQFLTDTPHLDATGKNSDNGHVCVQGLLTGRRYVGMGDIYEWTIETTGPSIDQHLGAELASRGFGGLPSLYQGALVYAPNYAVWRAAKSAIVPDWDPARIFSKLFAGRDGSAPDPELERLQRARKSVLDSVSRDFERFGRLLGTNDRARIDRHLESIRVIEKDLLAVRQSLACPVPQLDLTLMGTPQKALGELNNPDSPVDAMASAKIPALLKLHIDLLVAALATDVVRVAVLQLGDSRDNDWCMPWLGLSDSHHLVAHNDNAGKLKADAWIYSQWAYLVDKLKNEKEGARSVLDSSAVTFLNLMTTGGHQMHDVPAMVAGSCGGYFKTGRNLTNRVVGQYHQPLLVSIANALGVPLTSWGDPEYNSGEMPGLRG